MGYILGLNCYSHNTACALVRDGEVVFGVEEERLIRRRKTMEFPAQGVKAALAFAGITAKDLDVVAVGINAGTYLEASNGTQTAILRHKGEYWHAVANRLMTTMRLGNVDTATQSLGFEDGVQLRIEYVDHHLAHAASACFYAPFDSCAFLAIDGYGEKDSMILGRADGNRIERLVRQEFPHSLGCFYGALTEFLGFIPHDEEWKVMGASAYGDPERYYALLMSLIQLEDGGLFTLDLRYFAFHMFHRPGWFGSRLTDLLGPARQPGEALTQRHYDIAAATQAVTERVLQHILEGLHRLTGEVRLALAGGVAFNSAAVGRLHTRTPFRDVFVPPMPDDSGTAIGAALYVHHHRQGNPRLLRRQRNLIGPSFSDEDVAAALDRYGIPYLTVADPAAAAATLIDRGQVIGWFQGACEFGDRALGARSILADPRDPTMKDRVNERIKYREGFRPFAPAVLAERAMDWFLDLTPTPYMERVLDIRPDKRPLIPAVTHADGTGRLQTVTAKDNPPFHALISAFEQRTGIPVVLNTSFNLKGEPIVCSPDDALRTFYTSGLDALVMGRHVVGKKLDAVGQLLA